jgi:hypothetical protein
LLIPAVERARIVDNSGHTGRFLRRYRTEGDVSSILTDKRDKGTVTNMGVKARGHGGIARRHYGDGGIAGIDISRQAGCIDANAVFLVGSE